MMGIKMEKGKKRGTKIKTKILKSSKSNRSIFIEIKNIFKEKKILRSNGFTNC